MFDSLNYEAFDVEFADMQELLELSVKDTVEGEAQELASQELASQELYDLADAIELAFGESEEELIENLRMTADNNPISETAVDLTMEAMEIL